MIMSMSYSEITQSQIEKPIFVVGAPRSGTTLLYQTLAQHPDLGWLSSKTGKKFYSEEFLRFVYLRRRIFGLRNFSYPIEAFNPRFFSTIEFPAEVGYLWSMVFKGDWDSKISEKNLEILKKMIIEILDKKKKKRFISKYPPYSIKIPLIDKAFPDSKFIHIIRDGRFVVNSMLKRAQENSLGYFGIPLKPSEKKVMNQIEEHATQWRQIIEAIRNASKNLTKNQYLEIKYEDLIKNTDHCLNQVTKFCELPPFNFVYMKDGVVCNSEGKDKFGWELMNLQNIQNKNILDENDEKIEKYLLETLKQLNYV